MTTTLRPADEKQLRDLILFAAGRKAPVEIAGAGTKRAVGRPVEAGQRIELTGLAGIRLYEPEELVLTAGVGTRLAHIEAALATHRQQLAFEPADYGPLLGLPAGQATIGGVLAANLSGPRRVKAGAARDHFLGVECISGRGEPFKSGGRVVKNVTGYDLCKLLAGSWGTLAVMSTVTIKVLPAPEDTRTLLIHALDDARGIEALTLALQSPHEVSGAVHLPPGIADAFGPWAGAAVTAVRLEGFGPSVAARAAALRDAFGGFGDIGELGAEASVAFWRAVRDVAPFARDADRAVWRLSVPPASGPAVADAIRAAREVELFYDWGGGLIWVATDAAGDAGAAVMRSSLGFGGHATLIRGAPELRAAIDVFEPQPPALAALSRRVKEAFDPLRILNRGRMTADA